MSTNEILVVVGGLIFGYWVVSLLTRKKLPADGAPPAADAPGAAWHEVLQVSPAAAMEDIHAAYRSLVSQYHPDKVASLGAELQALADRKSKQIHAAYEEALRVRGPQP
jgi:DnaJ-domain-containing protein 1